MSWSLRLYSLLVHLARPFMMLSFVWRSRHDPRYRQRLAERFAWQAVPARARGGILVHAVSMGEVVAATPLIERLLQQYPELPVTVTCMSPTGSARVQQQFADRVHHWYLPLDTPGAMRRFLSKLAPQLIILLETELWPNLIHTASQDQIPVLVANARLSAKSARGYRRVLKLVRPMLRQLTAIAAQDVATARRFNRLAGVRQTQAPLASVCGNLKYEMRLADDLSERALRVKADWQDRPVWVAGSTHAGEDEQILEAHQRLLQQWPQLLLILVPRHPERFQTVAQLLEQQQLQFSRRSLQQAVTAETQVLLGDTMGELMLWYQAADLVFIGGSLIARGGHNPLEAMCLAKPIISGRHVFNFATTFQALDKGAAVRWADDAASLATQVQHLLAEPAERQHLAAAGLGLYQQQGGAALRTLQLLKSHWQPSRLVFAEGFAAGNCMEIYNQQLVPTAWSSPGYWQQQQAVVGQSTGRNTVYFVESETGQQWVLRHYYRGGFIGKFNKDWFWQVPLAQSRALAECRMLQRMRLLGLPVPEPIAGEYQARGWGYSANILIARIVRAQDLFHLLRQRALTQAEWQALGRCIARFHQAQVWHSDLNCHNILLDDAGQFYLIDFDKCGFRKAGEWQAATLARLERSFLKEQAKYPQEFAFANEHWQWLLQGYQAACATSS